MTSGGDSVSLLTPLVPAAKPLFFACLHASMKAVTPLQAVVSKGLPVLVGNLEFFQITLADISEAEQRSANAPLALRELTIEDDFGNSGVFHSAHMAEPAEATLPHICKQAVTGCFC